MNELAKDLIENRSEDDCRVATNLTHIEILLRWDTEPKNLRDVQSDKIGQLVKISGIIISATGLKRKVCWK